MKKKKILITGSNGLLGQKLISLLLSHKHFELIATSIGANRCNISEGFVFESMDVTDYQNIENIFQKYKPDVVIHTAAMTNVDLCEDKKSECRKLNVEAVSNLLSAFKSLNNNGHFIHLSTDFIFDGTKGPYSETDIPNPLSFYAQSKLDAEILVQNSGISWSIIRTVLVYGLVKDMSRSNIVLWAKESLENKKTIKVVDDQFRTPTLAEDLAQGCILAAEKSAKGIFNISGNDFMSILELVNKVAKFWKLDTSFIVPVKSNSLNQPAKRPPVTGFKIEKAISELGYIPHRFEEGLKLIDEQLSKSQKLL